MVARVGRIVTQIVMAPRRRTQKRRGRPSARNPNTSHYIEWRPSHISPGTTVVIAAANIEAPRDRSYKLNGVRVEFVSDKPVVFQVRIYGPNDANQSIANSGPVCAGMVPRVVSVRTPRGGDWFARALDVKWPIAAVDCLCLKKGQTADCYFVMKLELTLSPEVVPESCPAPPTVVYYGGPPCLGKLGEY